MCSCSGEPFVLILPPWGGLYHWQRQEVKLKWSEFFDVESLNEFVPVMEFEDFIQGKSVARPKQAWERGFFFQESFPVLFSLYIFHIYQTTGTLVDVQKGTETIVFPGDNLPRLLSSFRKYMVSSMRAEHFFGLDITCSPAVHFSSLFQSTAN